ncbi:hypothetical protein PoB_002957600 [Plakobranchus ocellatus]|uniref:Uncharacterized protein n=1 Tax=Plakobranchus ocellatus TaxID=259542 RepID=A0AAV3ZVS5_9GAST|nr:hypothetical protein PoB_002957600 [Plakobranchus ocellatus]
MFYAEDDDDSPKTPIVHPNDVLDIEVSPAARTFLLLPSASCKERTVTDGYSVAESFTLSSTKQRFKKNSKSNSLTAPARKQTTASMKRGDPFLPSVFSDENPIADFTVKKNSRKKPSDCKCKGFGYNLSPSALLPEEMRQQWGVGVFGKHIPIKSSSSANSNGLSNSQAASIALTNDGDSARCSAPRIGSACYNNSITSQNNINTNNSNNVSSGAFWPFRCRSCTHDPCLCVEMGQIRDGFRIPDYSEKRKQKLASKSINSKGKDTKTSVSSVIGSTFTSSQIKRSACFGSKDHSNIISTSNFPRNSPSPVHMPCPGLFYNSDLMGITSGSSVGKPVPASKVCPSVCEPIMLHKGSGYLDTCNEHLNVSRTNSLPSMSRRVIANISPAPIISSGTLDAAMPHNFQVSKKSGLSRSVTPTRRIISQDCACDSCRRRTNLMSTMEVLSLSTADPQQTMPPFLLTRPQRYNSRAQSQPFANRYSPYRIPSFSYKSTLRDVYGSPESYKRSDSPFYDYGESTVGLGPSTYGTSMSGSQELSGLDASALYLDCDSSAMSPPSMHSGSWMVEDITDLSVQETVEFFVNMKPPIITSIPSPQSDSSSDIFSPSPGDHRCTSPRLTINSSSCFCSESGNTGSWGSQQALCRQYGKENLIGFHDSHQIKFSSGENSNSPYPPTSMLYSSLVSDLEDELRCAIENIPTA